MSEDDTFDTLRRKPAQDIWHDFLNYVRQVTIQRGVSFLSIYNDDELEKWVRDRGWASASDLKDGYDRFLNGRKD